MLVGDALTIAADQTVQCHPRGRGRLKIGWWRVPTERNKTSSSREGGLFCMRRSGKEKLRCGDVVHQACAETS